VKLRTLLLVTVAFGATASVGCGSSGGGAAANCPAASETCQTALNAGQITGDDENAVPIPQLGNGAAFITALVQEASFDNRSISVRGTLASVDQTNYDLFLYVAPDAPGTAGASPCGQPAIAAQNGIVDANWPDTYDGSSQDRNVVFEVRPKSGACGGGWVLIIEGNTTSVTAP